MRLTDFCMIWLLPARGPKSLNFLLSSEKKLARSTSERPGGQTRSFSYQAHNKNWPDPASAGQGREIV